MMLPRVLVACSFLFFFVVLVSPAQAAEQRCTELGANCVCSEPLNTATFTTAENGTRFNPSDSTTKECGYEVDRYPLWTGGGDIFGSNDATAMVAAPPGHTFTRFAARPPGHEGGWWLAGDVNFQALGSTKYNARSAIRGYVYHSPDYNFRQDTPGCHSKFLQGTTAPWHITDGDGPIDMYEFASSVWGPSSAFPRDCCYGAPGQQVAMRAADWKNRWWFFEAVTINGSGPGWRTILYMKDVTNRPDKINNGVEFVAVDTFGTTGGPQPWTADFNHQVTSNPRQRPMLVNLFRGGAASGTGPCIGWKGVSHFMMAGWDTDQGQRIGPASEFEGGGGGGGTANVPPSAPSNPTIR